MTFSAAFYQGTRTGLPGLYNRLVRWLDRGEFSHCELVFGDGISASASFMDHGVRFKQIGYTSGEWHFVDLPAQLEPEARQWFEARSGTPYDVWGNLRFLFGFLRESDGKWFCSEAIAAALGLHDPWRYGPNGLFSILKELD